LKKLVFEDLQCDEKDAYTHQKVFFLESPFYVLTFFVIIDAVVMKDDTRFTSFFECADS
jgi:hypothetical protein